MVASNDNIVKLVTEELTKKEVIDIIKKDRDIEKKVKQIATEVIVNLFKVLWQHKNFYESSISK